MTLDSKMHAPESIYAYDDFRVFIKDRYEARKRADPATSARSFASAAGYANPGFLNDVIKGRRTLSKKTRRQLAAVFRLSDSETEYFDVLIDYGQAKKESLRQEFYKKILRRRNRSLFARMNPAHSRYYRDYRYSLICNVLIAYDFRGDYDQLSEFISPPIPPGILKTFIDDLCAWGMVIRQPSGRYTVTHRFIEPPSTLKEQVRQLNREWILHAADALMRFPADKRHISTMLLSVTPEACKAIHDKIEEFRQEVSRIVKNDKAEPSCIMQFNIQYFPRSKVRIKKC